jgi:hypothetical protein
MHNIIAAEALKRQGYITRARARELLELSDASLQNLVKRGKLQKYTFGSRRYFSEEEVLELKKNRPVHGNSYVKRREKLNALLLFRDKAEARILALEERLQFMEAFSNINVPYRRPDFQEYNAKVVEAEKLVRLDTFAMRTVLIWCDYLVSITESYLLEMRRISKKNNVWQRFFELATKMQYVLDMEDVDTHKAAQMKLRNVLTKYKMVCWGYECLVNGSSRARLVYGGSMKSDHDVLLALLERPT